MHRRRAQKDGACQHSQGEVQSRCQGSLKVNGTLLLKPLGDLLELSPAFVGPRAKCHCTGQVSHDPSSPWPERKLGANQPDLPSSRSRSPFHVWSSIKTKNESLFDIATPSTPRLCDD